MFKKIGVLTALAGTFLFSTAFQSPAHAQTCQRHHHKVHHVHLNGFHRSWLAHRYGGFHFYWIEMNQHSQNHNNNAGQTQQNLKSTQQVKQPSINPTQSNVQTKPTQPTATQSNASQPQTTQLKPAQNNTGHASAGQSSKGQTNQQGSYQLSQFEQQVVQLTNKERTSRGLQPLKVNLKLSKMARDKSQDMANNHYFSHQSPTYGSPFDMMKQYGISYSYAGENIAEGQRTPQEVVNAWMNSPGHRANILNSHYTQIGVGYVANGNIWTQDFIG